MSAALRRDQEQMRQQRQRQLEKQQQQQVEQQTKGTAGKRYGMSMDFANMLSEANDDFLLRLGKAEERDTDRRGAASSAAYQRPVVQQNGTMQRYAAMAKQHPQQQLITEENWAQRSKQLGVSLQHQHRR